MTMLAVLTAGQWALAGLIVALWVASMGAAWKVATILQLIAGDLREIRTDTTANTRAIEELRRDRLRHSPPE